MFLRLVFKNALRHKLRTLLTIAGLVVAIMAFGLLRTIVGAWYAGVEATSSARLVTRNAISLVFPMPLTYAQKLRQVPGVAAVSWANWFGGIYISERNFFPQFAVDDGYFDLYPEYLIAAEQKKAWQIDRTAAIVGRKLAEQYGWKLGDQVPLRGTIFPGTWTFTVRAIYDGADRATDTSTFFFHWDYLNETVRKRFPGRGNQIGVFILQLRDPEQAAAVSQSIDAMFRNSLAETLTETEKAFQLGFVSMTEAILIAVETVSFVIILIIMAVMANTMAMTARERIPEYATLKALGFGGGFAARLIFGESLLIALAGGVTGIALTFPVAAAFRDSMGTLFPIFFVSERTLAMQLAAALSVGAVAAALPAWRASRVHVVEGLRAVA